MSNWFSFHHIIRQANLTQKKKGTITQSLIALVVIIASAWLMNKLLVSQGFHPLQTVLPNHKSSLPDRNFSPSVLYWQDDIEVWADFWGLDPLLVATVMQIESCGNPQVISPAGAQGLFQVMPYHFQPDEDMLDPQTNARRGLSYLHESLMKSNGNVELALAGYNGGHSQITRSPALWPDETKRYVNWGFGIYQDALQTDASRKTLTAWLNAGGWQLCQSAEQHLGAP